MSQNPGVPQEIYSRESIEEFMDRVAFQLIDKHHPAVIQEARTLLAGGLTADQVQERIFARFSSMTMAGTLTACAIHYLEAHPELAEFDHGNQAG